MISFLAVIYLVFEMLTNRSCDRKMSFYLLSCDKHARSLASYTRVEICYGLLCLYFMFISDLFCGLKSIVSLILYLLNKCLHSAFSSVT